jgi:hypothetical protein
MAACGMYFVIVTVVLWHVLIGGFEKQITSLP